jgi:hypothetical protein
MFDTSLYWDIRPDVNKSKQLTSFEKGQIIEYHSQNLSHRDIAKLIGRDVKLCLTRTDYPQSINHMVILKKHNFIR